jgi:flagellar hook-basal body complex protein FliE
MIERISFPALVPPIAPASITPSAARSAGESFSSLLESAVRTTEGARTEAQQAVNRFLAGEDGELHNAVLTTQRAEMQFELLLQVRNKVVSAYQEIMRMQL